MSTERKKYALVTGASSGIGFATAIEFAKRGYYVFAGARRLEPMKELEKYGIKTVQLDVTSTESIQQLKELIAGENNGYLDVLYNNAGQSCNAFALDLKDEVFKQGFDVNVFGPMRVVRELGPYVINAKGVIGFTGSVCAVVDIPFQSVYNATKSAIHQYAATLRIEMKPLGVKVINFVTGTVDTNIFEDTELRPSSIYNLPEMEPFLEAQKNLVKDSKPMDPKVYARKVVNDFEKAKINGPLHIYRGSNASNYGYYITWLPRFLWEHALLNSLKWNQSIGALEAKYLKD